MTRMDDLRRSAEAALGALTPARAKELAKSMEPGAAKEQVAKTTADLIEWSQRNRERLTEFIRKEIRGQMEQMGVASQDELDAVKKRVRELERRAGMTASGRARSAKKTSAKKTTARKSTAKVSGAAAQPPAPSSG